MQHVTLHVVCIILRSVDESARQIAWYEAVVLALWRYKT
ncbi:hypothetical protein T4B_8160 [Trichinella pseudospiralis]|uniref:Uncharacterized protein n=1 Tax=Trichinella pseudospiralis TaxID=6337 RepID=A0A0V1G7N5_TRIPS|nr:hypothetical protein T4B_8160 [Trichinella pseudospiralis]